MENKYFYKEENSRVGDVIPKFIDGRFEIFYLKGYIKPVEGVRHGWHHISTDDLSMLGESVPIGVEGGTGDLIRANGRMHLFACIFPEGKQFITHYVSKDGGLNNWEYLAEDTFGPDGVIYDESDWRDPRIIYDDEAHIYHMFMCARQKKYPERGGCVGHCVSKDLKTWEYREPIYAPGRFAGGCECPDFFINGDYEYLIFSEYTNLYGTYYVKRKKGEENWEIPFNHRLESRAFYAAKTASDEKHRYLFGWNPTKEEDVFGYWPSRRKEKDLRTFDWGGDMVIHEIGFDSNGDILLSAPEAKKKFFDKEVPVSESPDNFMLEADLFSDNAKEMTVILRADERISHFYSLVIEPQIGRLQYKSHIRCSEEGGKTFPFDVEAESFFKKPADNHYHLTVIVEEEKGVAYVNNEAALSFRMCDYKSGRIAFESLGEAEIGNVKVYTTGNKQDML